jgi:hypothetical protein
MTDGNKEYGHGTRIGTLVVGRSTHWLIGSLVVLATGLSAHGQDSSPQPPEKEAQATLFPIPDYSGDLWSRSALTGD